MAKVGLGEIIYSHVSRMLRNEESQFMSHVERRITYFNESGPADTDKTLELVRERARELGHRKELISSFSGDSALKAHELMKGYGIEIICVSGSFGSTYKIKDLERWATFNEVRSLRDLMSKWNEKGLKEVPASIPTSAAQKLGEMGVKVVYGADPFSGAPYSIKATLGGFSVEDIILLSLRRVSPGLGVAVEVAAKAVDSGAVAAGEEVISTGGTERGLDTAIVIRASGSKQLFSEEYGADILEIICKPRNMRGESGRLLERRT